MQTKRRVLRYEGIGAERGNTVPAEEAEEYAMSACGLEIRQNRSLTREAVESLVEWFFSGCWVPVYEDEDDEYEEF